VLSVQPSTGAPSPEPSAGAAPVALWDRFASDDPAALRTRLDAGEPIDDLPVRWMQPGASPSAGRLDGRVQKDAQGRFAGYHGTFRVSPPAAAGTAPAPAKLATAATPVPDNESFSHAISHDLRAPLRVIEGFTKIIKEDYGSLLDRVGNDHLDRVLGAAARMNGMIDALLALSRLASQPLALQPVNLSQLAGYVADDQRRAAPAREVEFVLEPGLEVRGDPAMLRTLVDALIGNAWKFTARTTQARISFGRHAEQADAFTVQDNGAGFDMRFADRLFGVFQRLHGVSDFPGAGVGLASVRRIVRRHGGEVWAEAQVNGGARFHFSLPQDAVASG
jgi:signal transduction histidine kinase